MGIRQHYLTVIAPIAPGKRGPLDKCLEENLGYQRVEKHYNALLKRIAELHFISLFTFVPPNGGGNADGYLVLEANFDGSAFDFEKKLIEKFKEPLKQIFSHCKEPPDDDEGLSAFIKRHSRPSDCFYVSCPGLDRRQIENDRCLHEFLQDERDNLVAAGTSSYRAYDQVVTHLRETAENGGLLDSPPPPIPTRVRCGEPGVWILGVLILMAVMVLYVLAIGRWPALDEIAQQPMFLAALGLAVAALAYRLVSAGSGVFVNALLIVTLLVSAAGAAAISRLLPDWAFTSSRLALAGFAVVAWTIVLKIRRLEELEDKEAKHMATGWVDLEHMHAVCENENSPGCMQNHFVNLSVVKGKRFRLFTLRLVLRIVHIAGVGYFNKGILGGIPSIHFARWMILPKKEFGRDPLLLFMTNYDSSWDSYLGDFVDESSVGVSGIWSNTGGFPRTWYLLFDGGSRFEKQFKAYARQGQQRTLGWFAAYPNVSVKEKLGNAALRRALGSKKFDKQVGKRLGKQDEVLRHL